MPGIGLVPLIAGLVLGLASRDVFAQVDGQPPAPAPEARPPEAPDPPGTGPEDPVEALYRQGLSHYGARDYPAAAAAFASAYALSPRADILFAWAQAERLRGDCDHARKLFERFLAGGPPVQQIEAAELAMKRCESSAVVKVAFEPSVEEKVDAHRGLGAPATRWPSLGEVLRDRPGLLLSAAGLLALGLGATVMHIASVQAERAGAMPGGSLADVEERYDAARLRWRIGLGLALAGFSTLVTGGARYVWVAAHPGGPALAFGGQF